ncbi:cytochrome P450 [Streptosporangium sp. NPDC001681]|uniref:cytochrome P450 n=1 Tax=Streptosporangium sp. NPDC001681 TaxID=3154395 RepID=UPI003323976D
MSTDTESVAELGATFDPFERQTVDDPFPVWAAARAVAPIFWSERIDAWVVTGHALLEEIFRDAKRFPSGGLGVMTPPPPEIAEILSAIDYVSPLRATDPPDHTRQRRPTLAAVSPRRVAALEEPIREIADELIDKFEGNGKADFYREFAYPFPLQVISNLLGFTREDADNLHNWAAARVRLAWGKMEMEEWKRNARDMVAFHDFMKAQVLDRRDNPRDDGLTDFVQSALAAKEPMTIPEIVEQSIALVTGGHETTANWLTLSMFHMLSHRERWEAVVAGRYTMAELVEESLRYDSAVRAVWRKAAHDLQIGGVEISEGQRLYCVNGAANRDPAVFENPDDFCPGRGQARLHFTFGRASHHCIGASLSRLEGTIAYETLVRRLPSIRLTTGELRCEDNATLRVTTGLDVEWDLP